MNFSAQWAHPCKSDHYLTPSASLPAPTPPPPPPNLAATHPGLHLFNPGHFYGGKVPRSDHYLTHTPTPPWLSHSHTPCTYSTQTISMGGRYQVWPLLDPTPTPPWQSHTPAPIQPTPFLWSLDEQRHPTSQTKITILPHKPHKGLNHNPHYGWSE